MFRSAKLKLTFWYLSILTVITVSFSVFVYTSELSLARRALDRQRARMETRFNRQLPLFEGLEPPSFNDPATLPEFMEETLFLLVIINLAILGISGILSYFLAGKTLQPIEEMLEKQKRFVSDAAHELKTPLTVMKTNLEVSMRNKNMSREETVAVLADATEEVNRLNAFVNKLLKQSRYQNGNRLFEMKEVNLNQIVDEAIKNLEILAKEKNIAVKTEGVTSAVFGDKDGLKELFTNLIENAIKYSPNNESVLVKLFDTNNDITIEISDKGPGIKPEEKNKIFDPFFRSDKSRQRNDVDGFGLGLTICKEIVKSHNGTIHVNSELGKGSTFVICLPGAHKTQADDLHQAQQSK